MRPADSPLFCSRKFTRGGDDHGTHIGFFSLESADSPSGKQSLSYFYSLHLNVTFDFVLISFSPPLFFGWYRLWSNLNLLRLWFVSLGKPHRQDGAIFKKMPSFSVRSFEILLKGVVMKEAVSGLIGRSNFSCYEVVCNLWKFDIIGKERCQWIKSRSGRSFTINGRNKRLFITNFLYYLL